MKYFMKKLFASLIFGLLVSGMVSGSLTPVYGAGQLYGLDARAGLASTLYSINTSTGAATPIGAGVGFSGCGAMDYDTVSKKMNAICGNANGNNGPWQLITINLATGQGTLVATITGSLAKNVADMSFRSDNTLFIITGSLSTGGSLLTLNKLTGFSTFVGTTLSAWGNGMAFSQSDTLFHSAGIIQGVGLNTLNPLNAVESAITGYTYVGFPGLGNERMNAFDFMPGSNVLFGTLAETQLTLAYLTTIDPNTAVVTNIGVTNGGLDAIAFVLDVVVGGEFLPIDTTALMLAGLQSSAIWMLPILAGAAGVGTFYIKTRMNKD